MGGPTLISRASGDRREHEGRQGKPGKDQPIELEPSEIAPNRWHDGDHDERLDRDHELDEEDAGGQLAAALLKELAPAHRGVHHRLW